MKKTALLFLAMAAIVSLQAQWVDNPSTNTFIANCSEETSEIYTSTDPVGGDTYVQWTSGNSNGWAPSIQRLNFNGEPQWGAEGIHITTPNLDSWSPGYAMTATNDGGVVSMFRTADKHHWAVRINADGSFPWGEHGIMLFNGQGGERSELMAGNDGGVWALGTDMDYTYLQYISADGTLGQVITIGDGITNHTYGQMVPTIDNYVLVVYEKQSWAYTYYYDKEIWVAGYTTEGEQFTPEVQLMSSQTMGGSYCHYVVPDGANGGYAYIWHSGAGAFNTYVFHFDQYGVSTISDPNGIPVHSYDPENYFIGAYATLDPVSHDLIIAYEQTDAAFQSQSRIYMNRITSTGERLWGEGILVADYHGSAYSSILVDAFEDGSGFSIIYNIGDGYYSTVEALGFDMDGNLHWSTAMSTTSTPKAFCKNSTGFVMGQNVVAWANSNNGGIYGQNIGTDGTMGLIIPTPPPVPCCIQPENFDGKYAYNEEDGTFGAFLTWEIPQVGYPQHYNLYVTDPSGCTTKVEIEPTATEYFDKTTVIGTVKYQLTAVYEDEESGYALTPYGEDFLLIEITGIGENCIEELVSVLKIYTLTGQCIKHNNVNELSNGVYILQGLTLDGQLISRKVVVNR